MDKSLKFQLVPDDQERINRLCGPTNSTLRQIEEALKIKISNRGTLFKVKGDDQRTLAAEIVLKGLYERLEKKIDVPPQEIHLYLREVMNNNSSTKDGNHSSEENITLKTPKSLVSTKGDNQKKYLDVISKKELIFGIGPAGTGKTYLAMAMAVSAFKSGEVSRIILTRPAVEAGEKLGFLPGDIADKIDPYLRPIFDALYDMMSNETLDRYVEQNVIEVAPIAFMRGRTLNDSFIVFDEAQNSTIEQMKMFLTRLGLSSKAVVTGDITQTDLPSSRVSGLVDAQNVLKDVEGIEFVYFSKEDVVRHELVQRIIGAYDSHDTTDLHQERIARTRCE